jgi:hypothetical protein
MRVLVTGATGHVGRIVVEQLIAAGVRVRAMTRRPHEARFPRPSRPSPVISLSRRRCRPYWREWTASISRWSERWRNSVQNGRMCGQVNSCSTNSYCGGRPSAPRAWCTSRSPRRPGARP